MWAVCLSLLLTFLSLGNSADPTPEQDVISKLKNTIKEELNDIEKQIEGLNKRSASLKAALKYEEDHNSAGAEVKEGNVEDTGGEDYSDDNAEEGSEDLMEKFAKYDPQPADDGVVLKLPRNKGKAETVYKFKTAELRKLAKTLRGKGGEEEAEDYGGEEESPSEEGSVADKFAKYDPTPADDGVVLKLPRNTGKSESVYKFKTADLKKLAESLRGKGGEEEAGDYGGEEEYPSEESSVADKFAKYDPTPAEDGAVLKLPRNTGKDETVYKFGVEDLRTLARSLRGKSGKGKKKN